MSSGYDLVCLSHLRWDFVYQRPQHLLSRFARTRRVFFVEEPLALAEDERQARLEVAQPIGNLTVAVPRLPAHVHGVHAEQLMEVLLRQLFADAEIHQHVLWYYTPMAVALTTHLPPPLLTVYDCMDELSLFKGAPPELLLREAELFQRADLVFAGGPSLFEAKRRHHPNVHAFPSSVDVAHFATARHPHLDPSDQSRLPRPRLGFCGVLDERLDVDLLASAADLRPGWQFVLIGPVAKIEPSSLPVRPNIHYLGPRSYADLPRYLAHWDVALIPFAHNESTRFISPTKTPEYLAAGLPVVSTSIRDVVRPYHEEGLVSIADTPEQLVRAADAAMRDDPRERYTRVDGFLASMSWDRTWSGMAELIDAAIQRRRLASEDRPAAVVAA